MDALFREGQSGPQTPQTLFDADFEGLASNAEVKLTVIKISIIMHSCYSNHIQIYLGKLI